jgi:hypothetical protein
MDSNDLVKRLEVSERFLPAVLSAKQDQQKACIVVSAKGQSDNLAARSYNSVNARLAELTSGRGSILSKVGPATLYEFWLDVPGYSGTVKGAKAKLTQRGDIHQVSDVKGSTKGGLGGAAIGALAFGPVGAVVGAVVRRKTTVKTDVREVDTRQYELEIIGPGYAWSIIHGPDHAAALQKFRDMVNARGSRNDDVKALAYEQSSLVANKLAEAKSAQNALNSAFDFAMQKQTTYDHVWDDYLKLRRPIFHDLCARWIRSSRLTRIFVALVGPVTLVAWITFFFIAKYFTDPMPREIAGIIGIVHISIILGLVAYYFSRVRLTKSATKLPSKYTGRSEKIL